MSNAILINIQPKSCEQIANRKKTIEITKTKPKLKTPFKCYMYCAENGIGIYSDGKSYITDNANLLNKGAKEGFEATSGFSKWNGKVIGEFVCDKIKWIGQGHLVVKEDAEKALEGTCLSIAEIYAYLDLPKNEYDEKYRECYGWHISDLIIYPKPKDLSEFEGLRKTKFGYEPIEIITPPKTWQYVEDNMND